MCRCWQIHLFSAILSLYERQNRQKKVLSGSHLPRRAGRLFNCLSVCLFVYTPFCLPPCLPVGPTVPSLSSSAWSPLCLFAYLSVGLPSYLPACLPTCFVVCRTVCVFVCLPVCLPACFLICRTVCVFVSLCA